MDPLPSSDHEALREALRALLGELCPPARVRALREEASGYCSSLWEEMGRRGWRGSGSTGAGGRDALLDRALVFEELGRAAVPGPFLAAAESSLVLGALGLDPERDRSREAGAWTSLALVEESGSPAPSAVALRASEGPRLTGSKLFVPWAEGARQLLVVARCRDSELGVFAVDPAGPGIRAQRMPSLDGERLFEITFDGAPAEALTATRGGDIADALERGLARATILVCAELAGAARATLDYAVDYARRREQFGQPIGSFQAIQHHCANMAIDADAAHLAAMDAAARVDSGEPPTLLASRAKVTCGQAARRVTATGHQVLGGIGFLDEIDMHLWTRRVKVLESRLGTPDWHLERIADALALPG
jgi:alkylation response protein AidB-like acyl-CoA dehydrogenase